MLCTHWQNDEKSLSETFLIKFESQPHKKESKSWAQWGKKEKRDGTRIKKLIAFLFVSH